MKISNTDARLDVTTYAQLVELIENSLGWTWPAGKTRWQARAAAVAHIKTAIATLPANQRPTLRELTAAVEHLRRQRIRIENPVYLVYVAKDVMDVAGEVEEARPLADRITVAVQREEELQRDGWEDWALRLRRAYGHYREDALADWKAEGRAA